MIAAAQQELRRILFEDHGAFCERTLKIRNKGGVGVPARLSPMGERLWRTVTECRAKGRPSWIIVLKPRQSFTSTAVASIFFREVAFNPGQRADIVADVQKNTQNIYDYYLQFVDSYNEQPLACDGYQIDQPKIVKRNEGEIAWENSSRIKCQTARSGESGRSFSSRYLHLSEFAFYLKPARFMTGLMQTLPDDPGTIALIESTANGVGGEFHEQWQLATDQQSGSEWVAVFMGWHEHPEYTKPLRDSARQFQDTLSHAEIDLIRTYRLTLEQLHWRRWCITNKCKGSVKRFQQEYPICPEEAFLTSGSTVFDMAHIARMPREEPPMVGRLEEVLIGVRRELQFVPQEDGYLSVWKRPAKNRLYLAGADTSEGIDAAEEGSGTEDSDYSVANFIDQHTGEQVARMRGRFVPQYFAELVYHVARWYNWCYLVPEAKNTGLAFIGELLRLGYPSELIFRRQHNPNVTRPPTIHELGWVTTSSSKPVLVSALDACLREHSLLIHDPITLQELRTFVRKSDGKTEASTGCHDDEVISMALCAIGMRFAPQERTKAITGGIANAPVAKPGVYGKRPDESRGRVVRL